MSALAHSFAGNHLQSVYNADSRSEADAFINGLELWVKGFCLSRIQLLVPVSLDIDDPSPEMQ